MSASNKETEFYNAIEQYWEAYENVGNKFLEADCPIDGIKDLAKILGIEMNTKEKISEDNSAVFNFTIQKDIKFMLLGELLKYKYRITTDILDQKDNLDCEIIIKRKN